MRIIAFVLFLAAAGAQPAAEFDVVIAGGRVMDPESGLDALRHIGIRGGRIAAVSEQPLNGKTVLNAAGRVVAPGFIDLHSHGQTNRSNEYQAHDGVTTALELETGVPAVGAFLERREGNAILNSAPRCLTEPCALSLYENSRRKLQLQTAVRGGMRSRIRPGTSRSLNRKSSVCSPPQWSGDCARADSGWESRISTILAASREEIFRVFEMAARWKAPIFTHVRSMSIDAMQEVVANAAATGAPLHIVHVNSMSLGALPVVLDLIESARKRGLDVTTEAYPYTAASTSLQSAMFDEGWQERLGISYGDLQWVATGERLTRESFERYRKQGGTVIMHMMKPEWIQRAMAAPFVMIASDGMPYAPGAHPRSAGTFSRVLGYYVREQKILPLMDALAKMTIMPARRLEAIAPAMKEKGRIRVGADADITVFDPGRVRDTATFESGLSFSAGIDHVPVNGVAVVRDER